MLKTQIKKIIIICVYLGIFSALVIFIYFRYWPKPVETCSDGITNQNEAGVDCGGICQECDPQPQQGLKVNSSGFLESGGSGRYDLYGIVENPNNDFGSRKFEYIFTLKDGEGNVVSQKSGTKFILPGEKKYIVENNVESEGVPVASELEIKDPEWVLFTGFERPELRIVNRSYNILDSGAAWSEAVGTLRNETPFEFNTIRIQVILKDSTQEVVALNSTAINSVRSGENREFRSIWPSRFPGEVANMEIQAEVNVFDSQAFAKRYFNAREFRKYDYQYR